MIGPAKAGCSAPSGFLRYTAVQLTTLDAIPPNSQVWQEPRIIGGLTTVAGATTSQTSCNAVKTCTTVSSVTVKVPSNDVALIIWAGGDSKNGALKLASSIVDSIHGA